MPFFAAATALQPGTIDTSETAGIIAFQNKRHYIYLGIKLENDKYVVFVERTGSDDHDGKPEVLATSELSIPKPETVYLKIVGRGDKYYLYYADEEGKWTLLKPDVDARNLSTHIAGGFVEAYVGMYASAGHENSS